MYRNVLTTSVAIILSVVSVSPLVSGETDGVKGQPVERPNLVLILCDNLGYGDIEPFGCEHHRTPALNRMAREGMRFTHFCVTAGVCTPSRASIMTGCYAQRVGMHTNPRDGFVLRPISPYGLNPDEITIAEVLRERGYASSLIGKWHLGDQPEFLPTSQGFDEFFGIPYSDDMTEDVGKRLGDRFDGARWPPLPLMRNDKVIEAPTDRNELTRRYTQEALDFIDRHQKQPFFLFLSQAMPGSTAKPFASSAFRGKSRNGPWGDAVEELDWSTGQILKKIVQSNIQDRTLVIWTSDNGAPMARDGTSVTRGTNRPLYGRGYTTAEGAFRVPTLAWWPGTVPAQRTCDELVTTMDLLPTFARLAGTPLADDDDSKAATCLKYRNSLFGVDGHDIRQLLYGTPGAKSPYDAFFYFFADQLQAVRSGPWKLFIPLEKFSRHPHFRPGKPNSPLLFNVAEDVGSTQNLANQHADIVQQLTKLADAARSDLGDAAVRGAGQRKPGRVQDPKPPSKNSPTTEY